jgi:hypothetical protein
MKMGVLFFLGRCLNFTIGRKKKAKGKTPLKSWLVHFL